MLERFADKPERHWWMVSPAIAGAQLEVLQPLRESGWRDTTHTDWRRGMVLTGFLLAECWPTWFAIRESDPDEDQLIAGALALRHDPDSRGSTDGTESGPNDHHTRLPAGWIHGAGESPRCL